MTEEILAHNQNATKYNYLHHLTIMPVFPYAINRYYMHKYYLYFYAPAVQNSVTVLVPRCIYISHLSPP